MWPRGHFSIYETVLVTPTSPKERTTGSARIASVDQIRGYAILGMMLVNAKGLFFKPMAAWFEAGSTGESVYSFLIYQLSHHRTTFSYADTIAPLFLFVVGMGMRLSWLRRVEQVGGNETRKAFVRRFGLMILIAFGIYAGWLWDALMDIGLAGLLAVPFIHREPRTRIFIAFAYVAAYHGLFHLTSYGEWMMHRHWSADDETYVPLLVRLVPIHSELFSARLNGGPLGPLSWSMMLLFGSVAYDWFSGDKRRFVVRSLMWGVMLCLLGLALRSGWLGLKPEWPFSARWMTAPFPLWATCLCLFHLLAFHFICDRLNLRIPTCTVVGMNPLVIYIIHIPVLDVADGFRPEHSPLQSGWLASYCFTPPSQGSHGNFTSGESLSRSDRHLIVAPGPQLHTSEGL
ncbi:MAG: hypothetical protein CME26_13035 [Gemmatimonadetes bacterium]|nr:hypothetical protein [Gemmatimonadota bacterium]